MAEEFDRDEFRFRLLDMLTQLRINNRQLAAMTDTTLKAIKKWKNGSAIPNTESMYRICKATGISADWLLGLRE